jgi:hypothetical protein
LLYLRANHPASHHSVLAISDENLDALGDDQFVDDELIIHELEREEELDLAGAGGPAAFDDGEDDDPPSMEWVSSLTI